MSTTREPAAAEDERAPAAGASGAAPERPEDAPHDPPDAHVQGTTDGTGTALSPAPSAARSRLPVHLAMFLVAVLAGSTLLLAGFLLGRQAGSSPGTPESRQALFEPFWDAYNKIDRDYVGDVDERRLVQGAIRGVFEALGDPYSGYMSPDDFRAGLDNVSGRFEGIGAEMTTRGPNGAAPCTPLGPTCRATVSRVYRGSPALNAGVQAGDVIVAVDGQKVDGLSLNDMVTRVRGARGSSVTLSLIRGGGAPFELTVVRDVIQTQDVESRVLADATVGYLRIDGFSATAATDLRDQLRELVEAKGLKRLILDLRGDPGGFVDAARSVAGQFVSEGPLYWEEYADGRRVAHYAEPGGIATARDIQLVVLVDKGTASASEILAAALQEGRGATIVGQPTYGKGTIQQWSDLGDSGGFRLSIAKWLTPKLNWIHGKGITPDVPVAGVEDPSSGTDPVLDRALELLAAPQSGAVRAVPSA